MIELKNEKVINFSLCFIYACLVLFFTAHLPLPFISVLAGLFLWNAVITAQNIVKPNAWLANILAAGALGLMIFTIGMSDTVILFVAMLLLSSLFKLLQAKR